MSSIALPEAAPLLAAAAVAERLLLVAVAADWDDADGDDFALLASERGRQATMAAARGAATREAVAAATRSLWRR